MHLPAVLSIDGITLKLREVCNVEQVMAGLMSVLKEVRVQLARPGANATDILEKQIEKKNTELLNGKKAASLSADAELALRELVEILKQQLARLYTNDGSEPFVLLKADFDKRVKDMKKMTDAAGKNLSNVFSFCEEAFGDGQELLILVTELTISYYGSHFISRYGCDEYFKHNKKLLFYERQKELIIEIEKFELDE